MLNKLNADGTITKAGYVCTLFCNYCGTHTLHEQDKDMGKICLFCHFHTTKSCEGVMPLFRFIKAKHGFKDEDEVLSVLMSNWW